MSAAGVEIIAHRGYSARAPENTLAAVRAALDAGATSVEWDLQFARCGTPVLLHDETLDRTTSGSGPVGDRTAAELRELDAGGWFGEAFRGEAVPTLREALEACRGRARRVYPELKSVRREEDLDTLVAAVRKAGMVHRTTFISMSWDLLEGLGRREPGVDLGYVVEARRRVDEALDRATRTERAFLDLDYRIVLEDPAVPREARARGLPLAVWTVDDLGDATRVADLGVERITTNQVERLLDWRRRFGPSRAPER